MITKDQLLEIFPFSKKRVDDFIEPLNQTMKENDIVTPRRIAAFIAQIGHESAQLRFTEEIASGAAYEGRKDLGNTEAGDGMKFKGHGIIQITGRANHKACSLALYGDERLLDDPTLIANPLGACRSAGWFWSTHNLNKYADNADMINLTKKINGGLNGYDDRLALYNKALKVIGE